MNKRRIYVVGGDYGYANWCEAIVVPHMEDANIVMFTGGEDVSPSLYGKKPHPHTYFSPRRDAEEVAEYKRARELDLPLIGICRGAQFLCVMAGGLLVQHQSHPFAHPIKTSDGKKIIVSSLHHQRQYIEPIKDQAILLGWAEHLSPDSYGEDENDRMDEAQEAEMVYYKNIRALGIQSHPEMCYPYHANWHEPYIEYCRSLMRTYLE